MISTDSLSIPMRAALWRMHDRGPYDVSRVRRTTALALQKRGLVTITNPIVGRGGTVQTLMTDEGRDVARRLR